MKQNKRRKINKKRVVIAAGVVVYAMISLINMTTYDKFRSKSLDYALHMPDLAEYHNLILETERCSVLEKVSVLRLSRQKEAPILCTFKDEIPKETGNLLKDFKNIYIVGDASDNLINSLQSKGFRVMQYNGVTGFIKTVY